MSQTGEELIQIVVSHHLATAEQVEQARAWGAERHPDKDLAEHLFMRGVIDRAQVSLVRKLAKMNRGSGRMTPRPMIRPPSGGAPTLAVSASSHDEVEAGGETTGSLRHAPTLVETAAMVVEPAEPAEPTEAEPAEPIEQTDPTEVADTRHESFTPIVLPPEKPVAKPAQRVPSGKSRARESGRAARPEKPAEKPAGPDTRARREELETGVLLPGQRPPSARVESFVTPVAPEVSAGAATLPPPGAPGAPTTDAAPPPSTGSKGGASGTDTKGGASGSDTKGGASGTGGTPGSTPAVAPPSPELTASAARKRGPRPKESGAKKRLDRGDPTQVGRYEIIERVARGGMGVVYRARHPELDRVFALKLLTARMKDTPEAIARFQREAKLAARLDHPSVVRVYDAGTDEPTGAPYLVMDFVEGANLDKVIREEGLGVRKAAQITRSLALALQHAHERGIVHRDVKPENVLLDRTTGEPKLTDFGIVKDLGSTTEEEKKLTRTGYTLGSPCYMSPEQAAGRHSEVGPRSDVYSLAATLYEMTTGGPPFDGDAIHDIMVKVIEADPVPLRIKNPAIPSDLEVICLKGLEKEPDRRYQSAAEMAEDLRRFLEDEPILAKAAGWSTKLRRFGRRHRSSVVLALLLLLLVGAGAGLFWRQEVERRERQRLAREELLAVAERRISDSRKAKGTLERRRALYDALLTLEKVLDRDPANERARERKRQVILLLGDGLIESGEASFAEFVFGLGEGLVDAAAVASRLEAARMGRYEEAAREKEAQDDLEGALRDLRRGHQELTRAGYSGERFQLRIDELNQRLEDQRRAAEVAKVVEQAEEEAQAGQHAQALDRVLQALERFPDEPELETRAAQYQGKAEETVRLRVIDAEGARTRVLGVLGARAAGEPLPGPLKDHVGRGDAALKKAQTLLEARQYAPAGREVEAALKAFGEALRVATVVHAQAEADAAATRAEEANAARFAPRELGQAKDFRAKAQAAFERGRLEEAVQQFERAAEAYRLAARTGSGKESIADVWKDARELRTRAYQDLSPDHRLPGFARAEEEFQQAEAAYRREDWNAARDLYVKATAAWRSVLEQAQATREAFVLRDRAQSLRRDAEANLAGRFAEDELREGERLLRDGLAALDRSDSLAAAELFRKAEFRLRRAVDTARPQAEGLRESEQLREQVLAARNRAIEANLTWKPAYKTAESELEAGDQFKAETHWRQAKRRYERALRGFADLTR